MTVIDFKGKAFWKGLEKRFDLMRAHINYGGISRYSAAANEGGGDPIQMDAETAAAVNALFARYGFPASPRTWVEFRAAHAYIERVERGVTFFRVGFRHIPEHGIEFLKTKYSDVFDALMLVLEGDLDKLAAYHRKHKTYERLVRDYDETKELADPEPRESQS